MKPQTIDEYIAGFPPEAQPILQQVRATIRDAAPYAGDKGNLRFALDRPIPYDLILRIVEARVQAKRTRNRG